MGHRIVSVGVATNKLVQEVPNTIREAIVGAVTTDAPSIARAIYNSSIEGFNRTVNDYYNYAASTFVDALPQATTLALETADTSVIEAVISSEVGAPVTIVSTRMNSPKESFFARAFLQQSPDWELLAMPNEFVLDTLGFHIPASFVMDLVDGRKTYTIGAPTLANGTVNIPLDLFEWDEEKRSMVNVGHKEVGGFFPNIPSSEIVYQIVYYFTSDEKQAPIYWHYAPSTGVYPTLALAPHVVLANNFYPISLIRHNKVNLLDETGSRALQIPLVATLLDKININLEDITANLIDPDNPDDIEDIDEAFIAFAMDLNSTEDIAIRYFYEFFRRLELSAANDQGDYAQWLADGGVDMSSRPYNWMSISDGNVAMTISFTAITVRVVPGAYDDSTLPDPTIATAIPRNTTIDTNSSGQGKVVTGIVEGLDGDLDGDSFDTHAIWYRKELTDDTHIELVVHGLLHTTSIWFNGDRGKIVRRLNDMSDGGFFVPVERGTVAIFNGTDEALILYESLQLIIYALVVTKLKWYKNPAFLKIVGIVIIFVLVVLQLYELAEAIYVGITAYEIAIQLVIDYIVTIALSKGFELLAKAIGGDIVLYLAAIAAIASGSTTAAKKFLGLFDAQELMQLTTAAISGVNKNTEEQFLELADDIEDFDKTVEEAQEILDEANDLLGEGFSPELYTLIDDSPFLNFNESSDDYYNRTIHITNPGVLSLHQIESYVTNALVLPKPSTI